MPWVNWCDYIWPWQRGLYTFSYIQTQVAYSVLLSGLLQLLATINFRMRETPKQEAGEFADEILPKKQLRVWYRGACWYKYIIPVRPRAPDSILGTTHAFIKRHKSNRNTIQCHSGGLSQSEASACSDPVRVHFRFIIPDANMLWQTIF